MSSPTLLKLALFLWLPCTATCAIKGSTAVRCGDIIAAAGFLGGQGARFIAAYNAQALCRHGVLCRISPAFCSNGGRAYPGSRLALWCEFSYFLLALRSMGVQHRNYCLFFERFTLYVGVVG
jgi:hypothetical protein